MLVVGGVLGVPGHCGATVGGLGWGGIGGTGVGTADDGQQCALELPGRNCQQQQQRITRT